jgi:predicted peptidase
VLAPQIDSKSWFQSYSNTPTPAMTLTIQALHDVIKRENVDVSRVYVTGLSMGGMGTWDILGREPGTFAAAVPMSGGGDERTVSKFKDTPIWAFHGSADTVVPVGETRSMINALTDAGGDPKYTEIAGGGHAIWDAVYNDPGGQLYNWMFAQHLGEEPLKQASPNTSFNNAPDLPTIGNGAELVAIPEPTSVGIVTIGGIALLARRARRTM